MLAESQFCHLPILTMSNSDGNDTKSDNSPLPTSISPFGFPIKEPISNNPKLENQVSVSRSTEVEKRHCIGNEDSDESKNSTIPTSIFSIGYPISLSISNSPKLENQVSVSRSELKKRQRLGENEEESKNSPIPISIPPKGSPIIASISNTHKSEKQLSVKRRRLGEEIEENDDGFTTPTDSDHKIPVLSQCPPAPRKPSSRKSKSPPAMETRQSIFPVDVSDEEAESLFPPRMED